jgi:hypothetical protein
MLNLRNGWRKHASQGRRYPVSHLSGCGFSLAVILFCIVNFTGIRPQRCVGDYAGLSRLELSDIISVGLRDSCKHILIFSSVDVLTARTTTLCRGLPK